MVHILKSQSVATQKLDIQGANSNASSLPFPVITGDTSGSEVSTCIRQYVVKIPRNMI